MKNLTLSSAENINEITTSQNRNELSMNSPALSFLNDVTSNNHLIIESSVSVIEVKYIMQNIHSNIAFIVNSEQEFVGVVSKEEIIDRRVVKKVSEGYARNEIPISDFMIKKQLLHTLAFAEIQKATIADVVNIMQQLNENYCLVVEHNKVRGVFSAEDIAKKLHTPIYIKNKSSLYKALSIAS